MKISAQPLDLERPQMSQTRTDRPARNRARSSNVGARRTIALASSALLCLTVMAGVSPAYAATDYTISPDNGPTSGGTVIAITPPSVRITAVSASNHSLALRDDGTGWAWGNDGESQLGNGGANAHRPVPGAVIMPDGVAFTSLVAGDHHSLALDTHGNAWAWGHDSTGQLGDGGTNTAQNSPVAVTMPAGVVFTTISAGNSHSLALDTEGDAWAWGADGSGQLGNGAPNLGQSTPVAVTMPTAVRFTTLAGCTSYSLALDTHGHAWAWGYNDVGQLGDGGTINQWAPVAVDMPTGVTFAAIACGRDHSVALDTDGSAWAWGNDMFSQLGNGSGNTTQYAPVAVIMPTGVTFTTITAGHYYSHTLDSDGDAWSWGYDAFGRLGDGVPHMSQDTPVTVSMPAGVAFTAIEAGMGHSIALDADGKVWTWGSNPVGQLGDGGTSARPAPVHATFDPAVTLVTFDGIAGTDLARDPVNGTWSVTTPPHAPGFVDVVIESELSGVPMTSHTVTEGFTYTALLAATGADTDRILSLTGGALALMLLGLAGAAWARRHRTA